MTTDTSERGLETRICEMLTGRGDPRSTGDIGERPDVYGVGWRYGHGEDYDREHCVDLAQLTAFFMATQPKIAAALSLAGDTPTRRRFLARLKSEVGKRGIVDVLRNGVLKTSSYRMGFLIVLALERFACYVTLDRANPLNWDIGYERIFDY